MSRNKGGLLNMSGILKLFVWDLDPHDSDDAKLIRSTIKGLMEEQFDLTSKIITDFHAQLMIAMNQLHLRDIILVPVSTVPRPDPVT